MLDDSILGWVGLVGMGGVVEPDLLYVYGYSWWLVGWAYLFGGGGGYLLVGFCCVLFFCLFFNLNFSLFCFSILFLFVFQFIFREW